MALGRLGPMATSVIMWWYSNILLCEMLSQLLCNIPALWFGAVEHNCSWILGVGIVFTASYCHHLVPWLCCGDCSEIHWGRPYLRYWAKASVQLNEWNETSTQKDSWSSFIVPSESLVWIPAGQFPRCTYYVNLLTLPSSPSLSRYCNKGRVPKEAKDGDCHLFQREESKHLWMHCTCQYWGRHCQGEGSGM